MLVTAQFIPCLILLEDILVKTLGYFVWHGLMIIVDEIRQWLPLIITVLWVAITDSRSLE